MSVLCTHKMYKRTLLYIVTFGLLFRRNPNANTTFTMGCHLQGQEEDQSLHRHHHASTCWQQSQKAPRPGCKIFAEPKRCASYVYIYIFIYTERVRQTQYLYIYIYVYIYVYIQMTYIYICKYLNNCFSFTSRKQAPV